MRIAVINYCGTVGKTTLAAHLLAPRMNDAPIYAIETINETAGDLGLDVEKLKGDRYSKLFKELLAEDQAIIDVGASNVEDFIDRMVKYEDSHHEFDIFLVPVTPGTKEQKETMKTIEALAKAGVPSEKITVVFNRVDSDVKEEFAAIGAFASKSKSCFANPKAAIFENELFSMLSNNKTTIDKVLEDPNDYKAMLKALDKTKQRKEFNHYTDMHVMKSLARGVNRQLDKVYDELFNNK